MGAANREYLIRTFLPPLGKGSHSFKICTFQAGPKADLKYEPHHLIANRWMPLESRMNYGGN